MQLDKIGNSHKFPEKFPNYQGIPKNQNIYSIDIPILTYWYTYGKV